jgi:trafficking protein particle complex subunit 2
VNEWNVSAFVTAGNLKMILLHENKNEEGIRIFFNEVWELYVKSRLNPFLVFSLQFDTRVRQSAKKYL